MPFHPSEIKDFFWSIIEQCNKDPYKLEEILLKKDRNTIYKFAGEFSDAAIELTCDRHIEYMQVASEDLIEDMCNWIVIQGKDYYENVWNNPEIMPKYDDIERGVNLASVAEIVYEQKFGEEMPDTIDERGYPIHNEIDLE
jgi:hypothetical protein